MVLKNNKIIIIKKNNAKMTSNGGSACGANPVEYALPALLNYLQVSLVLTRWGGGREKPASH